MLKTIKEKYKDIDIIIEKDDEEDKFIVSFFLSICYSQLSESKEKAIENLKRKIDAYLALKED